MDWLPSMGVQIVSRGAVVAAAAYILPAHIACRSQSTFPLCSVIWRFPPANQIFLYEYPECFWPVCVVGSLPKVRNLSISQNRKIVDNGSVVFAPLIIRADFFKDGFDTL